MGEARMRRIAALGLAALAVSLLVGCSSSSTSTTFPVEATSEVDGEVFTDMQDSWIFKTQSKQLEVCSASADGTNVNLEVIDLYTLGQPGIYGSEQQVKAAIEAVLLAECGGVAPLADSGAADAGAIAQAEWDRTVRDIGSVSEVCDLWRGNNFDQGVMFGAAPAAIERAGYAPEDGKILEFVVSYDMVVRENCNG